jgi:hypothetical protein
MVRMPFSKLFLFLVVASVAAASAVAAESLGTQDRAPTTVGETKLGVMGDSMASGTHSSDMCGRNDIVECLDNELGRQSRDWSYAAGDASWSLARRLGYDADHVVDASDDGERWKDALGQATAILADPAVDTVFIGLGGNDVCRDFGHVYGEDLAAVAADIDETLTVLTDGLPAGGRIYWSGVPNAVRFRNLMARRDHHYVFENCQSTWDLAEDDVKSGAAKDACDHFVDDRICDIGDALGNVTDYLIEELVDMWIDRYGIDHVPCGKILNSKATIADRRETRTFTKALNELMADKAQQYDGRNGVTVRFSNAIYDRSGQIRPYQISRLDCYHPNRTGQMFLARKLWKGFHPDDDGPPGRVYHDGFDSQDYCEQEFTVWPECWQEIGEGDGPEDGGARIRRRAKLRISNHARGVSRRLRLANVEQAWVSFVWRREDIEHSDEYVAFEVSPDNGLTWHELDRFGDGDDDGLHRGSYYDISPYATAHTRIRFIGSEGLDEGDRVHFDDVHVSAWRAP